MGRMLLLRTLSFLGAAATIVACQASSAAPDPNAPPGSAGHKAYVGLVREQVRRCERHRMQMHAKICFGERWQTLCHPSSINPTASPDDVTSCYPNPDDRCKLTAPIYDEAGYPRDYDLKAEQKAGLSCLKAAKDAETCEDYTKLLARGCALGDPRSCACEAVAKTPEPTITFAGETQSCRAVFKQESPCKG